MENQNILADELIQKIKEKINSNEYKKAEFNDKINILDNILTNSLSFANNSIYNLEKETDIKFQKLHKYLITTVGKLTLVRCKNYKEFNKCFPYTPLYLKLLRFFAKKIIKYTTENENVYQLRLFNIPVFQLYSEFSNPKKLNFELLPNFKKQTPKNTNNIFYLKINCNKVTAYTCFQYWINIINELDSDFYIICDKPEIELNILRQIKFKNKNIKFLKSIKTPCTKKIMKKIASPFWYNATYAHLTPFYHANKNNIENFWNIDADDTMFSLDYKKIAKKLTEIKAYADNNTLSAFSLDMHTSKKDGKHWSFGITYINNKINWCEIFDNIKNTSWQKNYVNYDSKFNLDWFFTYLRDTKDNKIKSFYIDNMQFVHFNEFIFDVFLYGVYWYQNNKIKYPFLCDVFNPKPYGEIEIFKDCIKFENDSTIDECQKYLCEVFKADKVLKEISLTEL